MARHDWYCEEVLNGKRQVDVIYEDDQVLGFHRPEPVDPAARIHAIVIPKKHVSSALAPEAADGQLLASMMKAVQAVAQETGVDKTGDGFYVRFNAAAPGVTPHMHWHVKAPIPKHE